MVGEIRDRETADIAVQAALTGHLVLSTVHTNDALGAITRLRDMKVEPFLLASTLRAVVAQRLVRRLCPSNAAKPVQADGSVASLLGFDRGTVVSTRRVGCPALQRHGISRDASACSKRCAIDDAHAATDKRWRRRGDIGPSCLSQPFEPECGRSKAGPHRRNDA